MSRFLRAAEVPALVPCLKPAATYEIDHWWPMYGKATVAELDEIDFARDALSRISIIAADLGARKKSCVAGCLAAKLWIARKSLDSSDAKSAEQVNSLTSLTWPEPSDPQHPILRSVLRQDWYRSSQEAENRVRDGVLEFANESSLVREGYFKKLDQFSKRAMVVADQASKTRTKTAVPDADDYPPHVNSSLYSVIQAHSLCTCTPGHGHVQARHHRRRRLTSETVKVDGCVAFDMLLSASPTAWDYWQDVQMRVSMCVIVLGAMFFGTTISPTEG
ncbi:putative Peptidase S8/S53 domain-containing protein [Seiridium cardinale]|uniref:Peptidase S8/S53 domain-containing protein n=1 Tax=Seiridium cardinale TaxID=138064 RepID=A0ABR2XU06_9PEZI